MARRGPFHAVLFAVLLLSAAGTAHAQGATDPALARLEERVSRSPNSLKALRAVGVKYYELKRYQDAKAALEAARKVDPKDGVSALYLGLANEGLGDVAAAREAYSAYLKVGRSRSVKRDINARLVALSREELKIQAQQAVANEQALRGAQAPGTTVAVLPFRCACADTALRPLERGIAELVVSDLAREPALKVLERDRMQAIADEIHLSQAGQVDAGTATRAGKLVAAGRIVNGQIVEGGGTQLNLTGAVVNTNQGDIVGNPSAQGTIDEIFRTEREFVLSTFAQLGVTVSPEVRRELEERRVPSFQAFLAYSRGLMAEDEGRLDDAVRLFESARTLDPGFGAALQRAQQAAAARSGAQVTGASVQQALGNSSEGQVVQAAQRGSTTDITISTTLTNVVGAVNPTITTTVQNSTGATTSSSTSPQTRNTTAETTGTDQPAQRVGQVTIVIRKP